MNKYSFNKATLLMLALTIVFTFQANISIAKDNLVYSVVIERVGDFLIEPGNEPVEILRRTGRTFNKTWKKNDKQLLAAGFYDPKLASASDFLKPVINGKLSAPQKTAAQNLLKKYEQEFSSFELSKKREKKGFYLKGACQSDLLLKSLTEFMKLPENAKKMTEQQRIKFETQVVPILKQSNYIAFSGSVNSKGYFAEIKIHTGKLSDNASKTGALSLKNLSIQKFVNPSALMTFCQTHDSSSPAQIMRQLQNIPQTQTVINYLASAGLSLEKDILPHSAEESIIYLNLEPSKENGIPDLRFVAPLKNPAAFTKILPKLKTLCSQIGVFAKVHKEKDLSLTQLSYFMFPQYSIYAGLTSKFLVIATAKENLKKEMIFLTSDKKGKKTFQIPEGAQRFWRISFKDFNYQLQRFLQSPLMQNRGIPPISNLTSLNDLEDFTLISMLKSNKILLDISIPIRQKSANK